MAHAFPWACVEIRITYFKWKPLTNHNKWAVLGKLLTLNFCIQTMAQRVH